MRVSFQNFVAERVRYEPLVVSFFYCCEIVTSGLWVMTPCGGVFDRFVFVAVFNPGGGGCGLCACLCVWVCVWVLFFCRYLCFVHVAEPLLYIQ